MHFDFEGYGSAFLDKYLHTLRVLITDQSDRLFEAKGIEIPSPCISAVLFLEENRKANITDIANTLGYSHQLINQRLNLLERLKMVRRCRDVRDRRKSLITLTEAGKTEARKMKALLPHIADAFDELFEETGVELMAAIASTQSALERDNLVARVGARSSPRKRKRSVG